MSIFKSSRKMKREISINLHDEWEALLYVLSRIDDFKNLKEPDRAITFGFIKVGEKIVKGIGPFIHKYNNGLLGFSFKLWSPDGELNEYETKKIMYEMARTILVFKDRALKCRVHFERLKSKSSSKSVTKKKAKKKIAKKKSTKKVIKKKVRKK